jgi:hypothetical protein
MPKRGLPKTYYRIREWMLYDGPAERPSAPRLWDEDRLVYERLIQLRTLLFQKAHDYHDAMKVMMRTYGISEITFNRDYRGLTYIFGDLEEESKEFERARLKAIGWKIMQDCLAKGDNKTATSMHKNLIALGGHDREDADPIDPERLDPGMVPCIGREPRCLKTHGRTGRGCRGRRKRKGRWGGRAQSLARRTW